MTERFIKKIDMEPLGVGQSTAGPADGVTVLSTRTYSDLNGSGRSRIYRMCIDTTTPPDPSWLPTHEATAEIWLDASDTSTITKTGDDLDQIDNKIEDANHFTPGADGPTSGLRTVNSLNVLDFDGVDDVIRKSSHVMPSASMQFIITIVVDSIVNDDAVIRAGGSSRTDFSVYTNAGNSFYNQMYGTGNDADGFVGASGTAAATVLRLVFDDATEDWLFYQDGELLMTKTDGYETPFNNEVITLMGNSVSGGNCLDGALCEFQMFSTADNDVGQKAEGMTAHKWGVTLDSEHPYYSEAP